MRRFSFLRLVDYLTMLHDKQLFVGIQARIGHDLLVGQRTNFLTAALCKEECAVDNIIRTASGITQEAVFRQTDDFPILITYQQDIRITKRFDGLNVSACDLIA